MSAIITGLGWVTPLGRDLAGICQAITENRRTAAPAVDSGFGSKMPVLRIPEESLKDAAAVPRLRRSSAISQMPPGSLPNSPSENPNPAPPSSILSSPPTPCTRIGPKPPSSPPVDSTGKWPRWS